MRRIQLAQGILILFLGACASEAVPSGQMALKKPVDGGDQPLMGARECDPSHFLMALPGPASCCRDDEGEWFLGVRPGLIGYLIYHSLGPPCTGIVGDPTAPCSGTDCLYGPCWGSRPVIYGPNGHVFHPSDPTVCGRQADALDPFPGLAGFPEEWTGQEAYAGVNADTCPWTACSAAGPTVDLTVTAIADAATGHVKSIQKGIDITGAGTSTGFFTQLDLKLSAEPSGLHARAVLSGACVATSAYGQDIGCKLRADGGGKTVTVTYECQPGYSCK